MLKAAYSGKIAGYTLLLQTDTGVIHVDGRNGTDSFKANIHDYINEGFPHTAHDFAVIEARAILSRYGYDYKSVIPDFTNGKNG